jgi:hypothetical protein
MCCHVPVREPLGQKGAAMTVLEDLEAIEHRVTARIDELRPMLEEYRELEAAARRLGIDVDAIKPASRSSSRRRTRRRRAKPARRGARSSGRVQRRDQVLALINERPGISVPDIGKELGVDPTGLYRVVRQLQKEGAIRKEGLALQPA